MKTSMSARQILAAALLMGVTACSVTDYQQPITTFAGATKEAETALSTRNTEVTNAYTALLRERAVAGDALVELAQQFFAHLEFIECVVVGFLAAHAAFLELLLAFELLGEKSLPFTGFGGLRLGLAYIEAQLREVPADYGQLRFGLCKSDAKR